MNIKESLEKSRNSSSIIPNKLKENNKNVDQHIANLHYDKKEYQTKINIKYILIESNLTDMFSLKNDSDYFAH